MVRRPVCNEGGSVGRRSLLSHLGLVVVLALAAAGFAADSAQASIVWVSNSHTLVSGETRTVTAKLTKPKVRWEDSASTTKFEVECKKASGGDELKGGFPGTDKLTTLAFEECTLVKSGTGCKLGGGGVTTEELPGWASELGGTPSAITNSMAGVRFSLTLSGCEKGGYNKTWIFKGALKAKAKTESGKVKLTLPTLAGGAEPLEAEGDEAALSGAGELEEGGGTLATEEAIPRWYNEANERFAEGARTTVLLESVGESTFTGKLEGVEVQVKCPVLEGEAVIENPVGGGKGLAAPLFFLYKKCTVPKPGGTCKVAKGNFFLKDEEEPGFPSVESQLIYKGAGIFLEASTTSGTIGLIGKLTLEGCEMASLNRSWSVASGSKVVAEFANATSRLQFTSTSGSEFKLGGNLFTFVSEDKVETELGQKVKVG